MNRHLLIAIAGLIWSVVAGGAEPAAAGEQTSEQSPAEQPPTERPPAQDLSVTAEPRVRTSPSAEQPAAAAPAAASANDKRVGPVGNDRLQLDTTIVQGNRELPKVLYIVPWKKADIGELPSQPFNSVLDEALAPLDRDVFRREVSYYGVISGTSAAPQDESAARQQ